MCHQLQQSQLMTSLVSSVSYPLHCVNLKEVSDVISFYQWFQLSLKGRDFKRNHNTTFVLKSSLILSSIQCSLLKCHNSLSIILFHPLWLVYLLIFTFSLICFPDPPFSLPCNLLKQTNKQTNRFYRVSDSVDFADCFFVVQLIWSLCLPNSCELLVEARSGVMFRLGFLNFVFYGKGT